MSGARSREPVTFAGVVPGGPIRTLVGKPSPGAPPPARAPAGGGGASPQVASTGLVGVGLALASKPGEGLVVTQVRLLNIFN